MRIVRVFSGRPLARIPRLSSIFSGQSFHPSPAALSTSFRRTGGTFSSFSALFFAQSPLRGRSAKNRPGSSTFRKQRAWRPRQRIIHGIASLPADLVRLVRLIRTFLQRTIPDSAPNRHPGQSFHASPAALSTSSGQQQGLFVLFAHFSHFFFERRRRAGTQPDRAGLRQNDLRLRQK